MADDKRTKTCYVVGDIHGCFKELEALEAKIYAHAKAHRLTPHIVSVGDLIDRGPQSLKVVRHFMHGTEAGTHSAVAGNHEATFFEVLEATNPQLFSQVASRISETAYPLFSMHPKTLFERSGNHHFMSIEEVARRLETNWLVQGGSETLLSFGTPNFARAKLGDLPLEEVCYLFTLPLLWENEKTVVTHAAASIEECNYARTIQQTGKFNPFSPSHIALVEGLTWSRRQGAFAVDATRVHVSGHTPINAPAFLKELRSVQLDTGCVYGNQLTAWCEATQEFLSVPSQRPRLHD